MSNSVQYKVGLHKQLLKDSGEETPELQSFTILILSCKRNSSLFEHIHSKKPNQLTRKRLNVSVFMNYNIKLRIKQLKGTK
jgi:hypothetical protein